MRFREIILGLAALVIAAGCAVSIALHAAKMGYI